jgi:hypothetical protein
MERVNWRRTFFVLAAVLACALSDAGEPPSAFGIDTVRKLMAELGPQKAAEQVSSDSTMLEGLASGVASARLDWLDLGVQLAGSAETYLKDRLVQAFSLALQRDAPAVLERGAAGLPLEAVCGYDPFTGVDSLKTRKEFYEALAPRERALASVKRGDLSAAKATCLAALAQLKTVGAKQYEP